MLLLPLAAQAQQGIWRQVPVPGLITGAFIQKLYAVDDNTLIIGAYYQPTQRGQILRTTDAGQTWTDITNRLQPVFSGIGVYCIFGHGDTVYLNSGTLYKSVDKGNAWTLVGDPKQLSGGGFTTLDPASGIGYSTVGGPSYSRTTDSWQTSTKYVGAFPLFGIDVRAIAQISDSVVLVGGFQNGTPIRPQIARSVDTGNT